MWLYLGMHLDLGLMVEWRTTVGRKHSGMKTNHLITVSVGWHCSLDIQVSGILSILPQTLAQTGYGQPAPDDNFNGLATTRCLTDLQHHCRV